MSTRRNSNQKDGKSVHILLGEAEPGEARMYAREIVTFEPRFHVTSAGSFAEVLAALEESHPDILLLDLALPGGGGLAGFSRAHAAAPETLTIILVEKAEKDVAQRALEQGAVDYLVKGHMDDRTVLRALQCALWRREASSSLPMHGLDELTGLFNRRGFERMAAQHFVEAQRLNGTLVLLRVDVDNLEAGADGHGVLQATAQLLQRCFRRTDLLGRIREEGFAALLIDAAEPSAPVMRQRLERRLKALNDQKEGRCRISLSIGMQFANATGGGTFEDLLQGAEADLQRIQEEKKRSAAAAERRT